MTIDANNTNDGDNTRQCGTTAVIERGLAALTRWEGGETGAWRAAAASVGVADAGGAKLSIWRRPMASSWLGLAAAIVLVGATVAMLVPALGKARSSVRASAPMASAADPSLDMDRLRRAPAHGESSIQAKSTDGFATEIARGGGRAADEEFKRVAGSDVQVKSDSVPPSRPQATADRHVIRKATIELKSADVRATFAKAGLLVSEAEGEYLEASSLSGDGSNAMAQLTLRVSAARLSRVLNELRTLGIVTSENAGGEDVTDKVVDLEARIRNEQRVEGELLDLLKKQSDAKLKDVLELRGEINRVRERIEQLTGQREKLGRLTSLATVLVLIRADNAPVPVTKGSLAELFAKVVGDSWQRGLETLIETLAFLVRVFVGGLVWWLILLGTITAVVVLHKRATRRRASEPAPAV